MPHTAQRCKKCGKTPAEGERRKIGREKAAMPCETHGTTAVGICLRGVEVPSSAEMRDFPCPLAPRLRG